MSKPIKRTLCVILCVLLIISIVILIFACSPSNVYELGPYSITEDEYAYLMCTYKRSLIDDLGIDESYLLYPADNSGKTYGQALEEMYRESYFEQSVYNLIYSLALFDEYGLSLSAEEQESIDSAVNSVIFYYGNGSATQFDALAEPYGFSHKTIKTIYEKQAKETAVVNHIFGKEFSKITSEQKDNFYKDNYLHFQVLVLNTVYQKNDDGTFSNLSESERAAMLELEKELTALLCSEDMNFNYKILPSILKKPVVVEENGKKVPNVTFEELWSNPKINDDSLYPNGYFMIKPTPYQLMSVTTLTTAFNTKIGDVSVTAAKRYFDGNGSITTENGKEEIKEGDYFQYGSAYIKRLPMQEQAWKDEANKDFFPSDTFLPAVASNVLFYTMQEYEKTSAYTLTRDTGIMERYSLETIPANNLDYEYLHGSNDEEEK